VPISRGFVLVLFSSAGSDDAAMIMIMAAAMIRGALGMVRNIDFPPLWPRNIGPASNGAS
jgi:hypothetical protein